ncbi:hypothetical protein [Avibacterium endocarditidis]|uniref:hypothetical protein n=1 Tax=Avibacterium endocarditidis TaxID=380674 RepID=UPI000CDD525C|nr:hypothetical protein [Avibacterium endocarditidis]
MFKHNIQIKLVGKISNNTANQVAKLFAVAALIIAFAVLLGMGATLLSYFFSKSIFFIQQKK